MEQRYKDSKVGASLVCSKNSRRPRWLEQSRGRGGTVGEEVGKAARPDPGDLPGHFKAYFRY